jgi:hypothetical protein
LPSQNEPTQTKTKTHTGWKNEKGGMQGKREREETREERREEWG